MYHFEYVSRKELNPVMDELTELIHRVQDNLRNKFTFQYQFVGSVRRKMVTQDPRSNIGFDFDVNIMVNDPDENYSAEEIKRLLMGAFDKYAWQYGYDCCEDSTRVFTIKVKDRFRSRIRYSCDFAIVYDCSNNRQQYIRFNKKNRSYSWEYQPDGFHRLEEKTDFCRQNGLWPEVRELYLYKKNHNPDINKKSRSIFAETVHQICQQNGFYD